MKYVQILTVFLLGLSACGPRGSSTAAVQTSSQIEGHTVSCRYLADSFNGLNEVVSSAGQIAKTANMSVPSKLRERVSKQKDGICEMSNRLGCDLTTFTFYVGNYIIFYPLDFKVSWEKSCSTYKTQNLSREQICKNIDFNIRSSENMVSTARYGLGDQGLRGNRFFDRNATATLMSGALTVSMAQCRVAKELGCHSLNAIDSSCQ